MLGGVLAGGGFHMGTQPLPSDFRPETNAKGMFEDRETVAINEDLLEPLFPPRPRTSIGRFRRRAELEKGLRWAAVLPPGAVVKSTPALDSRIAAQVAQEPFFYKDPRFCYTLPAWRPFIGDALLICIFREPERTANSLTAEWERHPRRRSRMTFETGLEYWRAAYGRVLDVQRHDGDWLFVHYDQVLDGSAIGEIQAALGTEVDVGFPDPGLKRSPSEGTVGEAERAIYSELCALARHR